MVRSIAPSAPIAHPADRAVIRMPTAGSAIRLEKKTLIGVSNMAAFSMKNGRFSGKNTSYRWLVPISGSFDSTSLKSGLTVASTVTAVPSTTFASSPTRRSSAMCSLRTPRSSDCDRVNVPYGVS